MSCKASRVAPITGERRVPKSISYQLLYVSHRMGFSLLNPASFEVYWIWHMNCCQLDVWETKSSLGEVERQMKNGRERRSDFKDAQRQHVLMCKAGIPLLTHVTTPSAVKQNNTIWSVIFIAAMSPPTVRCCTIYLLYGQFEYP